jgi:hypothetical protein
MVIDRLFMGIPLSVTRAQRHSAPCLHGPSAHDLMPVGG